jgi:transcriptional regulator with XRE-family HTH domain
MIIPIQIRAARVLCGLSQSDLSARAKVGLGTIKRIEAAKQLTGNAQTISRIQKALEAEGIIFIDQDGHNGPGVRLRDPLD